MTLPPRAAGFIVWLIAVTDLRTRAATLILAVALDPGDARATGRA